VSIHAPPLRERGGDAMLLARHFLARFAASYGKPGLALTPAAERAIEGYAWPGNVRELRNVIEQAVLLASDPEIEPAQLKLTSGFAATQTVAAAGSATLEEVERDMVRSALERTLWNVSRAAQLLGISRDTLRYRIAKFGLQRPSTGESEPLA